MRHSRDKINRMLVDRTEFDNWSEFLDACKASSPTSSHRQARQSDEWRNNWVAGGFEGGDFDGSLDLARKGWEVGAANIQSLGLVHFEKLCSKIEQFDPIQDVTGLTFDVALVVQHIPECWQRMEVLETEGAGNRVIRINFNATVSAGISAEIMFARGAAIFALIELLELAGNRVELTCDPLVTTYNERTVEVSVFVKPADQPLDPARLAYALCHGGFLRRLGFALYETSPPEFQSGGYGMPVNSETSKASADIYIGRAFLGEPDWTNPESARAWILKTLKEQGVDVEA